MGNEIFVNEIEFSGLSISYDFGKVFFWNNRVFRAISNEATEEVKNMFASGMIDELVENSLFPKSWITDYKMNGYALVIEHEKIHPATFPCEWSFSMLADAAIIVLKVNLIARKYGYQTKDCHGFNVLFDGTNPKFVDLGSFVKVSNDCAGWIAYEEFMSYFYYPLCIWSDGNHYIAHKLLLGGTNMPHESYFLYKNPLLRMLGPNFLKKITGIYYKFRHISSVSPIKIKNKFRGRFGELICYLKDKNLLLLQSVDFSLLIKKIENIYRKKCRTDWSDYQNIFYGNNGEIISPPRFNRIMEIIRGFEIKSVLELAGNQGVFSRLLLERKIVENVICSDRDENAVDLLYHNLKNSKLKNEQQKITPALLDFIFPIMTCHETPPYERLKADAVVALAVTHHLILTTNIRIDYVFKLISRYSKRYVFIEFMPMGLYDGKSAPPTPSWYTLDWFRGSFKKYFNVLLEEKLEENRILFVGELVN